MQGKILTGIFGLILISAPLQAADVDFNVNLNVGNQPASRAVRAIPVVIEEPPVFLYPPRLGFGVAVDIPYDLVYIDGRYYLYQDDAWLVSPGYNGPWGVVGHDHLPPGLRKHQRRDIIDNRDREYVVYRKAGRDDHYRGKTHHPGRDKHKQKQKHKNKHDD